MHKCESDLRVAFTSMLMKIPFDDLFKVEDNQISCKVPVQISGFTLRPGIWYTNAHFLGMDILSAQGLDFEVEEVHGVKIVMWIYP